jgi:Ca2+-transporting ATPase
MKYCNVLAYWKEESMNQGWHGKESTRVAAELAVNLQTGLGQDDVEKRIRQYGFNELKEKPAETLLQKLLKQLNDFLVIILIVASIVSGLVGEISDALVIIAIVVVNAILGIIQEGKAEKALEALKRMSAPNARVCREGHIEIIPARSLVPGDIVLIEAGDSIPADMRLIESVNLKIDEASLTGESVPVEKDAAKIFDAEMSIGDRVNMVYMSTIATYGRGKGIVVDTGTTTEIGKIAAVIQSFEDETTPLQLKLNQLGKWLGLACLAICLLVFLIGFLRQGHILEMFLVAVSLAVAAIPEGLPAVVTIVLAIGMKRMAQKNAIIRKLLAVETLGCVTVICSDKTGTLTQNEMTVVKIYSGGTIYRVTGNGYNPSGEFFADEAKIELADDSDGKLLLLSGVLCNDAVLELKDAAENSWGIIGDPTEGALVVAGIKAGLDRTRLNEKYRRIAELPFDSKRKMMTTFHQGLAPEKVVAFTKGAPDIILKQCSRIVAKGVVQPLTDEWRRENIRVNSEFACNALRVLAFTYREYEQLPDTINSETVEKDLIFLGLLGMIDPARKEAAEAIKVCKEAGIKPVMITGDYRDTAVAIAKDLGLAAENAAVMTGADLDRISDDELLDKAGEVSVYARVSPEHKVRIVEILKRRGQVTAMTGDGVNDAMALKRSDIGVSMGITGTDVAKETADIILMDDNFATIVAAVKEGRIIYSNIRKFIFYLLSCNVGEILVVFISILLNLPIPLLPIQLLWLNLVTDSFPALALGTENGDPNIMKQKPRDKHEPILNKSMVIGVGVQSIAILAAVLAAYVWALHKYSGGIAAITERGLYMARTIAFTTLISAELFRAYSGRSEHYSIFKIGVFSNRILVWASAVSFGLLAAVLYIPFLQPIFKTFALSWHDWTIVCGFCIIPFLAGECYKPLARRLAK